MGTLNKPCSIYLFYFVDILKHIAFTMGPLDMSFACSINHNMLPGKYIWGKKCSINQVMNNLWRNPSVKRSDTWIQWLATVFYPLEMYQRCLDYKVFLEMYPVSFFFKENSYDPAVHFQCQNEWSVSQWGKYLPARHTVGGISDFLADLLRVLHIGCMTLVDCSFQTAPRSLNGIEIWTFT